MLDKLRVCIGWGVPVLFFVALVIWERVPESHTVLLWIGFITVIIMAFAAFIEMDKQQAEEADRRYKQQKLKDEERARLEMEEREARMAAYKAVAELAERGIDVRLPD